MPMLIFIYRRFPTETLEVTRTSGSPTSVFLFHAGHAVCILLLLPFGGWNVALCLSLIWSLENCTSKGITVAVCANPCSPFYPLFGDFPPKFSANIHSLQRQQSHQGTFYHSQLGIALAVSALGDVHRVPTYATLMSVSSTRQLRTYLPSVSPSHRMCPHCEFANSRGA
jgi:hypothetical protein